MRFCKIVAVPTRNDSVLRALTHLGLDTRMAEQVILEAARLNQKQKIEIQNIRRNCKYSDLVDVDLSLNAFGENITTKLTIFLPQADISEVLIRQIDEIEKKSLDRMTEFGLYPGKKLEILKDTFCSGLVHCAYSPQFVSKSGEKTEGFSKNQIQLLCLWIMLLFANDEDRDVFSIFETVPNVKLDNLNILNALNPDLKCETLSKKSFGMQTVVDEIGKEIGDRIAPAFFITTLQKYLSSTVSEVELAFNLEQPQEYVLEVLKEKTSGSAHAIAAGAALKRLDRDALLENETLDEISTYIARAVESHNDVNSHPKETRHRIKKLFEILSLIADGDFINGSNVEKALIDQVENSDHQFLLNFFKKAKHEVLSINQQEPTPKEIIFSLLKLISSFNRVDLYWYQGFSLQDSYVKAAERGNGMIVTARKSIESFQDDIKNDSVIVPRAFYENKNEFYRQAEIYINLNIGWGAQNIWEWVAKRYNEGLQEVNGQKYADLLNHIKNSI